MGRSTAPILGGLAACAVVLLTYLPYVFLTTSELAVYYGVGPVSPVVLGVFGAVALIVFGAILGDRTDPATATGAALVVGAVLTGLLLWWAITVGGVVGGLAVPALFDLHRWALVVAAALIPIAAVFHARTVVGPQGP